jgi:hypothetical protein
VRQFRIYHRSQDRPIPPLSRPDGQLSALST